jgi:hypothetical protein
VLPPGAVTVSQYYDRRKVWPAESLRRFERLRT